MKFKKIPKDYFPTILDRLTRVEPAEIRYRRVFYDIINKFSLDKKAKNLSLDEEIFLAKEIFNNSLQLQCSKGNLSEILKILEEKYFINNDLSNKYLSSGININQMLNEIDFSDNLPKNVKWLKTISDKAENYSDLQILREKHSLLYPVKKIILCEGETENTLLNTLLGLFDCNLDKMGILVLAAGGKNQVARKYYKMREYIRLPFFILLDKDAQQIKTLIQNKLRKTDYIYLIQSGEFEDLIPDNVLIKTVNFIYKNELNCSQDDFSKKLSTVHNLENIYKKYGFGEYKKAVFARQLKEYIEKNLTVDDFKNSEMKDIAAVLKNCEIKSCCE